MESLLLRQANVDDAHGIAHIHVNTWQSAYVGMMPDSYLQNLSVEQRAQNWIKILESPIAENQTIVAEIDGLAVGFIGIGPSRESNDSDLGEVFAIYVEPNFQGRGVGSRLMHEGIHLLKAQGFKGAMLWVLEQNIQTRAWYESRGWQSNGISKVEKRDEFELTEIQYAINF